MKLGITVSEATVSKYMIRHSGPSSQTWRTFLDNHAKDVIALDFFTVPTATFRILSVLIVLSHDRRQILHVDVTEHQTVVWTARQLLEACGVVENPRYLLRDRDAIYGAEFRRLVGALYIEEIKTAAQSPWQNPYAEQVIGSIRRECPDHVVILRELHLKRILASDADCYHCVRTHLSLDKDTPYGRPIHSPEQGKTVEVKRIGGLHHEYVRMAA